MVEKWRGELTAGQGQVPALQWFLVPSSFAFAILESRRLGNDAHFRFRKASFATAFIASRPGDRDGLEIVDTNEARKELPDPAMSRLNGHYPNPWVLGLASQHKQRFVGVL